MFPNFAKVSWPKKDAEAPKIINTVEKPKDKIKLKVSNI